MTTLMQFYGKKEDIQKVETIYDFAENLLTGEVFAVENGKWVLIKKGLIIYKNINIPLIHAKTEFLNFLPDNIGKG